MQIQIHQQMKVHENLKKNSVPRWKKVFISTH